MAGALQDYRRAVLIGTPTFGKGSIQTVFPLQDGSALKLTTNHYLTPNGNQIQENGITPDILVSGKPKEAAATVSDRLEKIFEKIDPQEIPPEAEDQDGSREKAEVTDPVLARAVDLLKSLKIFGRFSAEAPESTP